MKRCPKCDFSFADFHHVCDFDGTDLVDDPERPPLSLRISESPTFYRSLLLRLVKSPIFLTVLAVMALLASALLIGYYDAASQPNSIAKNPESRDSVVARVPLAQVPAQPPARIRTPPRSSTRSEISKPKAAKDLSSRRGRPVIASRSRSRFHSSPSIKDQPIRSEVALQKQSKETAPQKQSKETALQRDSKENANRKDSKVTATLKTTWNILKKPFKF